MRKKDDTLREKLLVLAKEMVEENGPDSINIRQLAKKANVASGTVYNYFANKEDILLALTDQYWRSALIELGQNISCDSFSEQIVKVYDFLNEKIEGSAGILMGSLGNVQNVGRERMAKMQYSMRKNIIMWMDRDTQIREEVWSETFTKEQFADFVMLNMIALLNTHTSSALFLAEIIKKTIY